MSTTEAPSRQLTYVKAFNEGMHQIMAADPDVFLIGEEGPLNGGFMDKWEIPKAELVPAGDGKISSESDRTLTFELHQTYSQTDQWGDHTRIRTGS